MPPKLTLETDPSPRIQEGDEPAPKKGPKSKLSREKQEEIIERAKKHFLLCQEAEHKRRTLALEDLQFREGQGQWDEAVKAARIQAHKPCLTLNVIPSRERQILNDQRENRQAIKVNAVDDKADPDTAEVLQGIIKHIEYISHADVCYDTAFAAVVRTGGPGWVRIVSDYDSPTSFQQTPKIVRVRNQFMVYDDPSSQQVDGSDSKFRFFFEVLTKEDYEQQYADSDLASLNDWASIGDSAGDWLEDGVRVAEYFEIETTEDTLYNVQNAAGEKRAILASKLPAKLPRGTKILDERPTETTEIHQYKINGYEVLEDTIWDGQWIPGVPFYGDELDVDGELIYEGMVRHVKDAMRMQNAMASAQVEAIALGPRKQIVAAAGQTEKYPEWKTPGQNHAVYRYDTKGADGTVVGPPVNIAQEPAIQAITEARREFSDDLKAITGIYDAQLGARSNENSGKAITARKQQGEVSNFHYSDNFSRGLRRVGLQLLDQIQRKMTSAQVARIIGVDGTQKTVKVNQSFLEGGVQKIFDLDLGTYDIEMDSGGSFLTRRQDAIQTITQLVAAYPPLMQVAPDLVVGLMDFDKRQEFVERLKKSLPPGMLDDDQNDPTVMAQQMQGKVQQLDQQNQQMAAELHRLSGIIETKQVEQAGMLKKALIDSETKLAVAEITTKSQDTRHRQQLDADLWQAGHDSAHETALQADDQAHQQGMQQSQQDAAAQQQQQAQAAPPEPQAAQ